MRKIAFQKTLDMVVNECVHGVEEREDLAVFLQKINDGLIETGKGFVLLVFTRIMGGPTVKNIPASVTGFVNRYSAFKREGVDRY